MASSSGTPFSLPIRGSPTGTSLTFLGSVMTASELASPPPTDFSSASTLSAGTANWYSVPPAGAFVILTKPMLAASDGQPGRCRGEHEDGGQDGDGQRDSDTCRLHTGAASRHAGARGRGWRGAPSPWAPSSRGGAPPAGCVASSPAVRTGRGTSGRTPRARRWPLFQGAPISPSRYAERISRSGHIRITFSERLFQALPGAEDPHLDVALAYSQDCSDLLVAQSPYSRKTRGARRLYGGHPVPSARPSRLFLHELLLARFRHPGVRRVSFA